MTDHSCVAHRSGSAPRVETKCDQQLEQSVAGGPASPADIVQQETLEEFRSVDSREQPGRLSAERNEFCRIVERNARAPCAVNRCQPGDTALDIAAQPESIENPFDEGVVQGRRGAALPSILTLRLSSSSLDCIWNIVPIMSLVALDFAESGS